MFFGGGSTPTQLAYFQTNSGPLTYNLTGVSGPPYLNQQAFIAPSYPNEHLNYCCGFPYATNSNYPPPNVTDESKSNGNNYSTNEKTGASNDDHNDSGIKSETSSNEQKSSPPPPPMSSANESHTNVQGEKRRDPNTVRFEKMTHDVFIGFFCVCRIQDRVGKLAICV